MKLEVSIPFQAVITIDGESINVVGSKQLLIQVREFVKEKGVDPRQWPRLQKPTNAEDFLINDLIQQAQKKPHAYPHQELCHCRRVETETVKDAIKAGCHSVFDVSRTTLAGTGCGSCRTDIALLVDELTA